MVDTLSPHAGGDGSAYMRTDDEGAFVSKDDYDALADELLAIKRTREQEADYAETCHQNTMLRAALTQMKEAIYWALGERDDFPPEPEPIAGKYRRRYWWRTELRKRSGLPIGGTPAETSVEHAPTCPVSRPGFVLIEGLQQCNCDFGRRLAKKLGMPFTEKTEVKDV
jgi:hypothetical protein